MLEFIGRNLRYRLVKFAQMLGAMLLIFAGLSLYMQIVAGESAENGLFFFALIVEMVILMLFYQDSALYFNFALSTCCTRRSAFAAAQVLKLTAAPLFVLAAVGFDALIRLVLYRTALQFDAQLYWLLVLLALSFTSIGEFFGMLTHRFGKVGAILFYVFCGAFGGLLGFSIGLFLDEAAIDAAPPYLLVQLVPAWFFLILAMLAVVLPVLSWYCFLRKYAVK